MSWVGGKKALREILLSCFPPFFDRYIEVFGGAGWLYFHKPPGNDFEVYNDFNGLLVNLYRCVREKPEDLIKSLDFQLNSREDFERIRALHGDEKHIRIKKSPNVALAAEFYHLIRTSYASSLTSYGCQPHDFWQDFPPIRAAHRRLAKTVVENKDFEALIHQYDRPGALFYLDPPYYGTESFYQNIGKEGFGKKDHIRLRDCLLSIEGKFILSYNKDPFIYELYAAPGICVMPVSRLNNIRQRFEGGALFEEYIIANFDLYVAMEANRNVQLTLFESSGGILQ